MEVCLPKVMVISIPGKVVPVNGLVVPSSLPSMWSCLLSWKGMERKSSMLRSHCLPLRPGALEEDAEIVCEPCNGYGWLLCDFCEGQKTNVKTDNNRIYRRCPSCKAIGYVLCPKCKVFKCVTFPDYSDGELSTV